MRNAPLDAAFSQIHRRGLGAPGPAQGCPLWRHAPRWTRRTWAIHPAALSRLLRGVASRDQPLERLRCASPPAAGRGLVPGVGHGSLPCAATAQQTNQESVAGAPPSFGSAWGPIRWFFGRPSPRLGPRVPGSFTSARGSHVNRIGRRSTGADLLACLDLGIEAAPRDRAVDRRLQPSRFPHCRHFLSLAWDLIGVPSTLSTFPLLSSSTFVIGDPVSLSMYWIFVAAA